MPKTTLEITDEVNVRFHGLDPATRRKLKQELDYFMPYAMHTPSYKLGRWNGMKSFCDVGGRSYLNLLDRLLPIVQKEGYTVEVDDKRAAWDFNFEPIKEDHFAHKVWPKEHPAVGKPVVLRDYQVAIINEFLNNPQSLQEIATGAGKTLITAALSALCEPYGRTIVVVPNKDLVVQTAKDYHNLGLDVGVLYGDKKEYTCTHTICTWQSLEVLEKNTKKYKYRAELGDDEKNAFLDSGVCWCCEVNLDKEHKSGCLYENGNIHDFTKDTACVMVDECFAAGTMVLTPIGYVPIETLTTGDKVINYSENKGIFKEDTVVKLHKNLQKAQSEKMYELVFDNGSVISVTGNHKFLTHRGWVRADALMPDDEIVKYDK